MSTVRQIGNVACTACQGTEWWERPSGGIVCARCHPDPRTLPRSPAPLAALEGLRARLYAWGAAQSWPEVRVQPWATLVGDEPHWAAFCRNAHPAEVEDALFVLGLEHLHDDVSSEVPDPVPQQEIA